MSGSMTRLSLDNERVYTDQELIDAVMCAETTTPGCHPSEIFPWLTVKPPAPTFRSSNLSYEIGFRWMLESEEWLKMHNMLIDTQEIENLSRSTVTFIEKDSYAINTLTSEGSSSYLAGEEQLTEFEPQETTKSIVTRSGFSSNDVLISKFPTEKSEVEQLHHIKHHNP